MMSPGRELTHLGQPRRFQIAQTQIMRTAASRVTRVAIPIKTLVGGISWWPVPPTRHSQRRKLYHHDKATTTSLQSEM